MPTKEQQIKMLLSMGLGDAAIDILCENREFEEAFKIAKQFEAYKIPAVHFRYAIYLEEEKRYHDAEEHYIKAGQISEVIQMYEHIGDFQSALRVARQHGDTAIVRAIYLNQGKHFLSAKDYAKAETCFLNAKEEREMVKYYCQLGLLQEARTFAHKYVPDMESDIIAGMVVGPNSKKQENMSGTELEELARLYEDSGDYSRAIDTYLEISEKHYKDAEKLVEVWHKAVNLALEFDKNRARKSFLTRGKA